jgi:RimJ/RimL family protein N-acetyltransferase
METKNDYFNQKSDRLIFRKLTKNDIVSWAEFFINNDRLHFLGMDLSRSKEILAEEWIMTQFDRYVDKGLGHLAVEIKESKTFIGLCGVIPRVIEGENEYEIAYSIKPTFWKKGFGTEMAKQMKSYGKEHIDTQRFISIIHIDNVDSINVAKKNGMEVLYRTEYLGMTVDVYGIEK